MSDVGGWLRAAFGLREEPALAAPGLPDPVPASPPQAAARPVAASGDIEMPPGENETPSLPVVETPYASSDEHLDDELRRVDSLVRAQFEIWQATLAAHKTHEQLALPIVTAGEVAAWLAHPFGAGQALPAAVLRRVQELREASEAAGEAIARRRAITSSTVLLRVEALARRFALTPFELDVVLLCLLPARDARYRRLFGYLLDDGTRSQPTVGLAQAILGVATASWSRDVFAPQGTLVRRHLLVLGEEGRGDEALTARSVRLDGRIVDDLLGRDTLAAPLAGIVSVAQAPAGEIVLGQEERERLAALAAWQLERRTRGEGTVLHLHGPYGSGRRTLARMLCEETATPLLIVDVDKAPRGGEWSRFVAQCCREATLRDAGLCWANGDPLLEETRAAEWDALLTAAEAFTGLTVLTAAVAWDPAGRFRDTPFLPIAFPPLDFADRRDLWRALLPPDEEFADDGIDRAALAETLANGFQLTPGQMHDAVATARWHATARDPGDPRLRAADLAEGCRRQSSRRLIAFSTRIEARSGLDFADLILPETNLRQVQELRARLRHQGRVRALFEQRLTLGQGLIALFTGGSGTGKTMAAELLARDQGLDLYKIDLSAVVSRYVGDTEKNLARVFAEAADANAVLFFDEADAIFGKRAKVERGQDRWANMEVNYLLQRVEEYAGVVILASNLRQNIDEAFMRRIQVIVEFPFPEAAARLEIIRGLIPRGLDAPPESDLAALAERFRLPGGSWKNIVVDAAFRAAVTANGCRPEMTTRHLVLATAREYQKLGKPLTRGEFGVAFFPWVEKEIL